MPSVKPVIKVGILIPTCNRLHFLKLVLQSVFNQSYKEIEVIIIDNSLAAEVPEFISSTKSTRLQYVRNEQNLGLLGSINKGVRLFSPEVAWCTILPDDDLLDKDFIAAMVAMQAECAAQAVIHGKRVLIGGSGEVIREALPAPRFESAVDYLKSRAELRRETFLTGVFFSRQAFEAIGGYPQFATGMATDDAFIFALSLQDRLVYAEHAVACIRMHEGAESHDTRSCRHLAALLDFKNYVIRAFDEYGAAHGEPEIRQPASLAVLLEKYVGILASSFWLRDVKHIVNSRDSGAEAALETLCGLVPGAPVAFSLRVRTSVALKNTFGFFPEWYLVYRAFWELAGSIKNYMSM